MAADPSLEKANHTHMRERERERERESWLAVIVPLISLWCFLGSRVYYFIVVNILFYYDIYIILLC